MLAPPGVLAHLDPPQAVQERHHRPVRRLDVGDARPYDGRRVSLVQWQADHRYGPSARSSATRGGIRPTGTVTLYSDSSSSTGFGTDRTRQWRALVAAQRQHRNQPGGYWIAEAAPDAAAYAIRARWPIHDLAAVMAMTDGVANGVDRYRVPADWHQAMDLARADPARLVNLVHEAEQQDPDGVRWPRSKPHDDKAITVVELAARSHPTR